MVGGAEKNAFKSALRLGFAIAIALTAGSIVLQGTLSRSAEAATTPCSDSGGTYYKQVVADHPFAYYRLDETSGPTACDDSGNGNSGTYAGSGITYGEPGALKNSTDAAISASGSANPVTVTSSQIPTGNSSFTLEGWFSTKSTHDQMLVDIGQSGEDQVAGLGIWNSGSSLLIDLYQDSASFTIPSSDHVLNGKWHFIAVTHSSTSDKIVGYLDGKKLGTAKHGALNLAGGTLRIGYWVDTTFNQPFDGSMDEVAAYPNVLSKAQIATQYTDSGRSL